MSDQKRIQRPDTMGNCLPVTRCSGRGGRGGRGRHDDHDEVELQKLRRIISEATDPPIISYPIDDTMPVKAWVYEKKHNSKNDYKPLRPEDERKAIEVLNRHLPFWDQIEIPQPPATVPEFAATLRPRLYPEAHLPLPPRTWSRRERREAARPYDSPRKNTTTKSRVKKPARRAKPRNWIQTDCKEEKKANVDEMEDDLPVIVVPDLVVTRPDGETRRLRDPNKYISGK